MQLRRQVLLLRGDLAAEICQLLRLLRPLRRWLPLRRRPAGRRGGGRHWRGRLGPLRRECRDRVVLLLRPRGQRRHLPVQLLQQRQHARR